MSVIVGIICRSGIVVASESQTTFTSPQSDSIQRLDTQKISVIEFQSDVVLIAEAGESDLSSRAVEIFGDLAKGKAIEDYRTVADLARESVVKLREEFRTGLGFTVAEFQDYILSNGKDFCLMIAHYHDKKPYIFTIRLSSPIAVKNNHSFLSTGVRGEIANYILSQFNINHSTPFQHGIIAAIYAVEEIKKLDPHCNGKTRLAVISASHVIAENPDFKTQADWARMMLKDDMAEYVEAIASVGARTKAEWAEKMNLILAHGNKAILAKSKKNFPGNSN